MIYIGVISSFHTLSKCSINSSILHLFISTEIGGWKILETLVQPNPVWKSKHATTFPEKFDNNPL